MEQHWEVRMNVKVEMAAQIVSKNIISSFFPFLDNSMVAILQWQKDKWLTFTVINIRTDGINDDTSYAWIIFKFTNKYGQIKEKKERKNRK